MAQRENSTYSSCNCRRCRHAGGAKLRQYEKRKAHRLFRRLSRAAIRTGHSDLPGHCPNLSYKF